MGMKNCKNCNLPFCDNSTRNNQLYCNVCQIHKAADCADYRQYWYTIITLTTHEIQILKSIKLHQKKFARGIQYSKLNQQIKILTEAYRRKVAYANPKETEE